MLTLYNDSTYFNKLGHHHYDLKDYGKALEYFKLSACVDDEHPYGVYALEDEDTDKMRVDSLCYIGMCYANGCGVVKNIPEALVYFQLCASKHHLGALNALGEYYFITKNHKQAFIYFKLNADKGDPIGMFKTGYCYQSGYGTDVNKNKAFGYFILSGNQGHVPALYYTGRCYARGNGVAQNYKKAFEYYKLSYDKGYHQASDDLADCYFCGNGVEQDYKKAFDIYTSTDVILIREFELLMRPLTSKDFVYVYPLYVKHNYNGMRQLRRILNSEYLMAFKFMPKVLQQILVSYLL